MWPIGLQLRRRPSSKCCVELVGAQKKTDLRTLLGEHASSEEGQVVRRNHQNFMTLQNALYLCPTPKGENEDLHDPKGASNCHSEWVSSRHRTPRPWPYSVLTTWILWVARNGQTDETNYQGLHTLPSVWGWPPQGPFMPHCSYGPLDLLHVDFTSIETSLEPNQSPRVTNILVFQDHFTKHMLAYVTPDQTAKTIAKFYMEDTSLSLGPWPGS